jgi:hypothetical protein
MIAPAFGRWLVANRGDTAVLLNDGQKLEPINIFKLTTRYTVMYEKE